MPMEAKQYTHILVLGVIFGTLTAYSIGANDEANFFACSVGSSYLTLRKAFFMAFFCETIGGTFLGADVAEAIIGNVFNPQLFKDKPELLMLGYLCALIGTSSWLLFASKIGWPVSTGHAIVGSMTGVGIAAFGWGIPNWAFNGLGAVIASWFAAPAISCCFGASIYKLNKTFILSRRDSLNWGLSIIPVFVFVTCTLAIMFLVVKSGKGVALAGNTLAPVLLGSFGAGIFGGGLSFIFLVPWLKRRLIGEENLQWYQVFYHFAVPTQPKDEHLKETLENFREHGAKNFRKGDDENAEDEVVIARKKKVSLMKKLFPGLYIDVYSVKDASTAEIHNAAEKLDPKTEYLFIFPQLLTACVICFAHGSNDLQNAVGPLSGIYNIWEKAAVPDSFQLDRLLMVYGAAALSFGCCTFGWHTFTTLGNHFIYHSPARSFAISMGTLITAFIGAYIGIPALSLTHSTIGASTGVGLVSGGRKAVNMRALGWYLLAALITDPICGMLSGGLYAFVVFSPY